MSSIVTEVNVVAVAAIKHAQIPIATSISCVIVVIVVDVFHKLPACFFFERPPECLVASILTSALRTLAL